MGFDGIFLHKIKNELDILKSGRISKLFELTPTNLILQVRANKSNYNLNINLSAESSRIHITYREFEHLPIKNNFYLFLKKNIEGFFISDIFQYKSDRIIILKLEGFSEMRDKVCNYLIIETMGKYSNLILTDSSYIILDSLFHNGINEFNRIIIPNKEYEYPTSDKLIPFDYSLDELKTIFKERNITSPKDILTNFLGTSYTLANMCFFNDDIVNNFYNMINNNLNPSLFINNQNKEDFYYYSNSSNSFNSLSELLDEVYYDFDKKNQIKKEANNLLKFVTKQINKYESEIDKLNYELNNLDEANTYKLYGELLLSYKNLKEKTKFVTVYNYYDNTNIKIDLDNKYTVLDNSQRYYKKYQKIKKSLPYIKEQIDISLDELNYFKLVKNQIETANLNDILEIKDELSKYNYIKQTNTKKKKNQKPNITTYILGETLIVVGKNNIQNEYITHKLARKDYLWFHVKDSSGSHVVIMKENDYTEEEIRTAANLASLFSPFKDSSSVAVDYTKIKYIKSIPGKRKCFVTYTNQNTIYIDPDKEIIKTLKEKK